MDAEPSNSGPDEEQALYARVLETGTRIGFVLLLVCFAIYVSGIVSPAIPIADLQYYWNGSAQDYLETINAEHLHREHPPTGWGWTTELNHSDFLNFLGVALLSGVTIVCYLWILPSLIRKKDWIYAAIAATEILVLALAASGLLTVGH